jgi:FlaA1/EpsC-like NDP-sugar epimerase
MASLPLVMKEDSSFLDAFLRRIVSGRVLVLLSFHAAVFAACYLFAWLVRFDFSMTQPYARVMWNSLPYAVLVQLAVAAAFGFFRGWWRYVGMSDVVRLAAGVSSAIALLYLIWYVGAAIHFQPLFGVSRAVLLIDWAFTLLVLFAARVFVRLAKDLTRKEESLAPKRVLIIGAGDAGEALAREIQHRPQLGLKITAFVDDQRAKLHSHIRGVEVRGPIADIAKIASDTSADEILLAIPSASGRRIREIIHQLREAGLPFRTVPGIDQLVSGKVQVTELRPVNVDDLLRREQIRIADDKVRDLLHDGSVVVTGAGGSIGSELALQILKHAPAELHLIEHSELALYECCRRLEQEVAWAKETIRPHLLDCANAGSLLTTIQPTVVIHAAAHKHVPLGEQNPIEYVRNNCLVARRFAEQCATAGVERFVFISTDKAVNPTSVLGASKRAAEISLLDIVNTTDMQIMVVRFGNVIGSSGSVAPLFLEQIAAGGPVTITHREATRYFIRSSEAISLVLQTAVIGQSGNVYMLDMGEPIRIEDLARDMIQLSHHTPDEISIVYTGLRPGEKLHEEVTAEGDSLHATEHPQVMMVAARQPSTDVVRDWLHRLGTAVAMNSEVVNRVLQELIPEYVGERETRDAYPAAFPIARLRAVRVDN